MSHIFNAVSTSLKELPRILALFDIDMELQPARVAVRHHFTKNAHLKDRKYAVDLLCFYCTCNNHLSHRVIELLVAKGYMELEETLMMWKQKCHVMAVLEVSVYFILFNFLMFKMTIIVLSI